MKRVVAILGLATLVSVLVGACGGSEGRGNGTENVLRLGIFPNLTHAPGYVANGNGIFDRSLGTTKVELRVFNSGSDAGVALTSGSIDATYIGPGPTASLFLGSGGVKVVSGAVSGGASFVVLKGAGISSPQDLHGKTIAVPGAGNTQDVALRTWLHEKGLEASDEGGDVDVTVVDNVNLLQLFETGGIDGAWEPEPWPSYLIDQGVAEPFVDEAMLWPGGQFVTTELLVSSSYMGAHPDVVDRLVEANVKAIQYLNDNPEEAKSVVQQQLLQNGAPAFGREVIDSAWGKLRFTWDPIARSQQKDAQDAFELGVLVNDPANLTDVYDLKHLNQYLTSTGREPVQTPR